MKSTQNGSRRWILFGTVKRRGVRFGIAAMVTLSMAACQGPGDTCPFTDEEKERTVRVLVDEEIHFVTIQSSGECTELVEAVGVAGSRGWETKMTGPVGSTCKVRLDVGSKIREETTKVVADSGCGYPGAVDIVFVRE